MKAVLGGTGRLLRRASAAESRIIRSLRPAALPALRILLGVLFVWFGALKVAGVSPVADIVAGTLPWADLQVLMPGLGVAEVLLGTALVAGIVLRLALPVLAAHLCGTFLTFLMLPGLMFTDNNPLLLTTAGEFVMKNLVLIGAALVLAVHAPAKARTRERCPAPHAASSPAGRPRELTALRP
ncbi:DoxX family protein [Arthrobacter sp. ISL-65]|uniref:DoxX family protein n=1 Tax=Arthrobacter sp. ISL-65 TaxID=2819112 RepID=UPI001BE7D518|nr:DoxX family protein [Arthrobacter sp. ISL-65]MBT2547210.1 DoxX family protein [Arthrobacter sp. ISL-65]